MNRRFLIDKAVRLAGQHPRFRVLDYGCGAGELVMAGRHAGIDVIGVDPYIGREDRVAELQRLGLFGTAIHQMPGRTIPFPDNHFSVVVSNEVFEHVSDLDLALTEIRRVLVPGGSLVALFPARNVVREGHIGIPMAHWFSAESRFRLPYIRMMRRAGLGYHKLNKSVEDWCRDSARYLDEQTFYRSYAEIIQAFRARFDVEAVDVDYAKFRLQCNVWLSPLGWAMGLPGLAQITTVLLHRLLGIAVHGRKRQ